MPGESRLALAHTRGCWPACPYCTSGVAREPPPFHGPLDEQVGDFALHALPGPGITTAFYTGPTLPSVFQAFAAGRGGGAVDGAAVHGAVSATVKAVPPGGNVSVTIVLGWRFEKRCVSHQ